VEGGKVQPSGAAAQMPNNPGIASLSLGRTSATDLRIEMSHALRSSRLPSTVCGA
jgi:hypothetical protein